MARQMLSRFSALIDAPMLKRLPGLISSAQLALARYETLRALAQGSLRLPQQPVDDAPRPDDIPSVAKLGRADRVLAEIDQDGFAFAKDPLDEPYFNRRAQKLPRIRYRLEVVLYQGRVCLRKQFTRQPPISGRALRVWGFLGLLFYTEAAALLRLQPTGHTPRLHRIELLTRTLYMDYLRGETLQHRIAQTGAAVLDIDNPPLTDIYDRTRDWKEIEAFSTSFATEFRPSIETLIQKLNAQGVAPLDVKYGNILIGEKTGALYWLDFENAYLASFPNYAQRLKEHHRSANEWFGLKFPE